MAAWLKLPCSTISAKVWSRSGPGEFSTGTSTLLMGGGKLYSFVAEPATTHAEREGRPIRKLNVSPVSICKQERDAMTEPGSVTGAREFSSRLERIRQEMRAKGIDALFVTQPTNVWYLSAFWEFIPIRMEAVLVPLEGDCAFIVSKNEFEYASKVGWIKDVRYYTESPEPGRHQNPYDLITDIFREKNLEASCIGVEESFLPIAEFRRLTAMFPKAKFVDGGAILAECRMVKSPFEIDLLKKSGKVAVAAWNA